MVGETHPPWNWYQNPKYWLINPACVPNFQKEEFTATMAFGFTAEQLSDGEFLFPSNGNLSPQNSLVAHPRKVKLISAVSLQGPGSLLSLCANSSHTLTCIRIHWRAC